MDYDRALIYSKPNCPYCVKAEYLLSVKGIDYDKLVIGEDLTREEFLEILPNARTVPQIFLYNNIEEVYIGGYDQLNQLFKG